LSSEADIFVSFQQIKISNQRILYSKILPQFIKLRESKLKSTSWLGAQASLPAERASLQKASTEIQIDFSSNVLRRFQRRSRQGCLRSQR